MPDFERWKPRLAADLIRHNLIARDARLDVDHRLARLNAGQIGSAAAAMIAGAIQQGAAAVVRQIAEQSDVAP